MATRKTASDPADTAAVESDIYPLDRRWHLARDHDESLVTQLEYALLRASAAFDRWQSECLAAVMNKDFSSTDNVILHIVRMKDRPKGITEIARLMDRNDIANLQYSIKKLTRFGLIERDGSSKRRGTAYKVTAQGREVTDRYAEVRANVLVKALPHMQDKEEQFETAEWLLNLMKGLYDQASLTVVSYRDTVEDD
ncbi:MAG TPA: winged helix DNA-binding protein [Gammaproteobacteria bacterium]